MIKAAFAGLVLLTTVAFGYFIDEFGAEHPLWPWSFATFFVLVLVFFFTLFLVACWRFWCEELQDERPRKRTPIRRGRAP